MSASWKLAAMVTVGISLGLVGGCDDDLGAQPPTTGGAGGTTSGSTTSPGGGGSGPVCIEPMDGRCDELDDCECALCAPAALCRPDGEGCIDDSRCDVHEDSCTCSDCDWAGRCFDGHVASCIVDGTCDFASEGCGCPDCHDVSTCQDNQVRCAGGAPDGTCDTDQEDCPCTDCLGSLSCLCPDPGDCPPRACICEGCWSESSCDDPAACVDDGLCAWDESEGCHCPDCAAHPLCAGYPG